jgi:hypothetical protein
MGRGTTASLWDGRLLLLPWGIVLALLLFASAAAADLVVCGAGSGVGQCLSPTGVAVDRADQIVYVADNGNQEVDAYKADGTFLSSFAIGVSMSDIAVDNDPISTAQHDVYVLDSTNNRVLRYHKDGAFVLSIGEGQLAAAPKLEIGPGGVVNVVDRPSPGNRRLLRFSHEGAELPGCPSLAPSGGEAVRGFAVDSTGNSYVTSDGGTGAVRKYDSSCELLATLHPSFSINSVALDSGDNLLVADVAGIGGETAIYAYTPAGALFQVLYGNGTLVQFPSSLAALGGTRSDLFSTEGLGARRVVRIAYEPEGPVVHPDPKFTTADPIGNTKATLHTRVNPEGKPTSYHFQYADDETYQADRAGGGDGFGSAKTSTAEVLPPPETPLPKFLQATPLFAESAASAQIGCASPENPPQPSCLVPQTLYHFRAVASNADGGPRYGPEKELTTEPPFRIIDWWANEVGADAARLTVQVNPLGIPTGGHFEYVDEASYLKDKEEGGGGFTEAISSPELDFGASEATQTRSVQLHSLKAGTAYRYRLVVKNAFGLEEAKEGAFRSLTLPGPNPCTNEDLRAGPSAALPDCRAYEMVSPVDKAGGQIALGASDDIGGDVFQSAATVPAEGRGLTYSSDRAFGDAVSAPNISQYLASRHPVGDAEEGWTSHGISPPREGPPLSGSSVLEPQYKAFSEDLAYSWLRNDSEPPLTEDAIPGFRNVYRRESETDDYEALCPLRPPSSEPDEYELSLAAHSGDGETTALQASDQLTANAVAEKGPLQVYACKEGRLVLVSVLPGGEADPAATVGTLKFGFDHREDSIHNAVSEDGSRIYWSDMKENSSGEGKIYLRENPFGEGPECGGAGAPCTREVSEAVGLPGADKKAIFWTASPDGARAIFSFKEEPLVGNLYEFDATVASEPTRLIAEGVSGLAGWSEDASRLYLVSTKALVPEAVAGKANLYLYEAGAGFRLVTALPSGPVVSNFCEIDNHHPGLRCTRATADGEQLAFMSHDPLTGYDNSDASSPAPCGEPGGRCDSEVFLYDASANEGQGELLCVSCNPSGGRPAGRGIPPNAINPSWIAGRIPRGSDAFYASRALAADGRRLFFESFDRLVAADTNGALDVYEWERAGNGSCKATSPEHVGSAGGCITLISAGQDRHDSRFVDASLDGSDVFFRTSESLWPEDPGLIDIYDARAGGGFQLPEKPQPPCEGEACQSPPAPPEEPTPASAVRRPGNPPAMRTRPRRCPNGKRRRRGGLKAHCVKKARAKRRKGGR